MLVVVELLEGVGRLVLPRAAACWRGAHGRWPATWGGMDAVQYRTQQLLNGVEYNHYYSGPNAQCPGTLHLHPECTPPLRADEYCAVLCCTVPLWCE